MKTKSLRFKLVFGGILVAVIPLAIVCTFSIQKSSSAINLISQNRAQMLARDLAFMTDLVMEMEMSTSEELAHDPTVLDTAEKVLDGGMENAVLALQNLDQLLREFYENSDNHYERLFVTDSFGNITADNRDGEFRKTKISMADRDYFAAAKKGKALISTPVESKFTGKPVVVAAVPLLTSTGQFAGILGIVIKLDFLSTRITQVKIGQTGYAFMIDGTGVILAHPDEKLVLKLNSIDIAEMKHITGRMMSHEMGADDYRFKGVDKIAGFAPVATTGWSVCVTQDKAEFLKPVVEIRNMAIIAGVVFLGVTILGILWFVRGIMAQLGHDPAELVKVADRIANGDLTVQFDSGNQKITGVYASMAHMTQNLSGMFTDISGGVHTLTASSGELSSISRQMAAGAEQTSEKSNTVATAAEEMATNMNSVAAATEQTTANIQMIVSAVEEMSSTISEISANTAKGSQTTAEAVKKAEHVSGKVGELGRAASEISKVTQAIADISEQTNLLALNATIEAARAGDAGKGFAVVAGEIKALAQQTAGATDEISEKIADVQSTTRESVSAIESIVMIINEIDTVVTSVAAAIEEQSSTTREISSNVSQAATGVQEVNENVNQTSVVAAEVTQDIHQVSQASDEMKTGSVQVQSSARDLSELAEKLNSMVGRFKLN